MPVPPPPSHAQDDAAPPYLRLVGLEAGPQTAHAARPTDRPHPGTNVTPLYATDPRWVLAIRVSERLEGTLLNPEQRERLVRLGTILGLTPFDANLIIAIVQDRARRGIPPAHCPAAAADQLATLTPAQPPRPDPGRGSPPWSPAARRAATLAAAMTLVEVAALWLWLA